MIDVIAKLIIIATFVLVGIWFAIITAITITNHLGVTGINWWIVTITIFGALGGTGGSLISIGMRD